MIKSYPFHRRVFPPLQRTPNRARTTEKNKGVLESRTLESRPVAAEDIGFPFAAQVGLLTRQHVGRKNETVGLITDRAPDQLPAAQWLKVFPLPARTGAVEMISGDSPQAIATALADKLLADKVI